VLLDPVALERWAGGEPDLRRPLERALLDPLLDLGQAAFGRLQQRLAPVPALGGDERVAADDEALVG